MSVMYLHPTRAERSTVCGFNKGAKERLGGKQRIFNKWCWENGAVMCKPMKLDHYITLHTKINSKWVIKDLNIRPETLKLLAENIGSKLHDISLGNDFLCIWPKQRWKKTKTNKENYVKLKHFSTAQKNKIKMKRQSIKWQKIFPNHISSKKLISQK